MKPEVILVRPPDDKAEEYFVPGVDEKVDPHWLESLGMGYVAAYLRRYEVSVAIIDGTIDAFSPEKIVDDIVDADPLIVGFSLLLDGYVEVQTICRMLRERGYGGHLTIGQHFATFNAERVLKDTPEMDTVVRFEGELTALALYRALTKNTGFEDIPGLVYRDASGAVRMNEPRALVESLDTLPFPARDVLARHRDRVARVSISGSRGCPWRCKFCSITTFYQIPDGKIWRARSPKNIVDEMQSIKDTYGLSAFTFADDQFMGAGRRGRQFAQGFAQEILSRNLSVNFCFETRADSIDRETFLQLREAGLDRVFLGIESGYQPTLDYYRKDITVETNLEAIRILQELEIDIQTGFIMFHERSTLEEVKANLSFLRASNAFTMTTFSGNLQIRAGTTFMDEAGDECLTETYEKPYEIHDLGARTYKALLREVLPPLTTPTLYIHNRKRLETLHRDVIRPLEAQVRSTTLDAAERLLSLVEADDASSDKVAELRSYVESEATKIQFAAEFADLLTGNDAMGAFG